MPRRIQIYDTTLRDGSQGEGVNFSLQDKLQIAQRLDQLGVDFIEGGYPLSNEKDAEFFQRAAEMEFKSAKICAFGMTRRRSVKAADDPGMKALLASKAPVITIVGKTSDFHVKEVLRVSFDENIEMISDTVKYLCDEGRRVIYDAEHAFDGWKANPEYAAKTIQAAAAAGAETIVLCDTNGGSMPEEIAEITKAAIGAIGKFDAEVGIHCHNDCELGVANSLAGLDAGAVHVQGTINGIGERCGNADLISVMANLCLKKKGYAVGASGDCPPEQLTEVSRFVYEVANLRLRDGQAFVGQSAFAHKGGMHVHAVNRVASSYEHIDPESVGNERRVLVSELSGRSNIVALTTKHNLQNDAELMNKILQEVVKLENLGYQFEAANASFDLLVKRCAGTYQPHFQLQKYHIDVDRGKDVQASDDNRIHKLAEDSELTTEATVKLRVGESDIHEVAEGDGPVNALDAALRKGLNAVSPFLANMRLVDYKVRVVNEDAGTAARIRVVIESTDGEQTWGTVGVNENIIEASWRALVDAIEYKICMEERSVPPPGSASGEKA